MGEPGSTKTVADWWKGLSAAWRANVGLYGLATVALAALVAQIAVGGGGPAQRVEVASRAPVRTAPTAPRPATTTTVGPTTTAVGSAPASAPDTTAPPQAAVPTPSVPRSVAPAPAPQDSTTVPAPVCRNTTDPSCGQFFWDPPAAQNQPLSVSVVASPSNPRVGDVVTFTVRVTDPDHPVTTNCAELAFGDGPFVPLPCSRPQCPDAHGPWDPPPAVAGDQTYNYTHQYASAGSYRATFTFHSDDDPPCPDPYGSANSGQIPVTVAGP